LLEKVVTIITAVNRIVRCDITELPITMASRSKAVFARSNAEIVSSNPTGGMDVCVRLFYACVVLFVRRGLAMG
jgi:hypothetical protein